MQRLPSKTFFQRLLIAGPIIIFIGIVTMLSSLHNVYGKVSACDNSVNNCSLTNNQTVIDVGMFLLGLGLLTAVGGAIGVIIHTERKKS